jgi:pantoate--beta-alanine ligase
MTNKKVTRKDRIKIITDIHLMQKTAEDYRLKGKKIGVVPTMGFLHDGHLSLLKTARKKCDVLILTIFVNPTQFAPNEDYNKYPRDINRDIKVAKDAGVNIIFSPEPKDMYPNGFDTFVINENLSAILEGEFRPTHFKGVTTVVYKLFNITKPHFAIFGQKDAQQARIIKKMVEDLNLDIKIIVAPIIREKDGLALSSRNIYLNEQEREDSLVLNESIKLTENLIVKGYRKSDLLIEKMIELINSKNSAKIDYIKIVDPATLADIDELQEGHDIHLLLAVKIGTTRLIDNKVIKVKK